MKEYKKERKERAKSNLKKWFKEIKVSLTSCEGLAWKPDGTITVKSNGRVYSENGKLIAQGIKGSNLCWITNDSFIFRGTDRALYFWKQGKGKKLLRFVPEEFSYCSRSPLAIAVADVATADKEAEGEDKIRLKKRLGIRYDTTEIYIGTIKTLVGIHTGYTEIPKFVKETVTYKGSSFPKFTRTDNPEGIKLIETIEIATAVKGQEQLEFALVDGVDINDIKDPSRYDYGTIFLEMLKKYNVDRRTHLSFVDIPFGQVLLLKNGNKYAAVRPVKFEPLRNKGKVVYQDIKRKRFPQWEWLVYEWKYWPEVHLPGKDKVVAFSSK